MIEPVTAWFKITQYENKCAISIGNLVETVWLDEYTIPMDIMYDQGSEFIRHDFRKYLIEMVYWILSQPSTLKNPTFNTILERIHQVMGKPVQKYIIK